MSARLLQGDCLQVMRTMEDASVDSIVTDPPYELGFMGKSWDSTGIANSVEMWTEAYRVLKPGGHMLAFSSTRTQHRMVCAIEDAGFEIRDCIRSLNGQDHYPAWVYGSGFPKSLDVSKAIDKAAGAEREVVGTRKKNTAVGSNDVMRENGKATGCANFAACSGDARIKYETVDIAITAPATPEAQQWAGWGTALKPAWEPICVARKPLSEKSVAANVLEHGTGALNIDGCRVVTADKLGGGRLKGPTNMSATCGGPEWDRPWMHDEAKRDEYAAMTAKKVATAEALGRWPANVIHDGSDEVLEAFAAFGDRKCSGANPGLTRHKGGGVIYGECDGGQPKVQHNDTGTAARFFYSAKAGKADRAGSSHPTVKPISLMRYLCKLVTPPGGTVLDMFAGSGTTLQAALEEGFSAIGIEREEEYARDIRRRLGMEDDTDALLAELFA